MIYFGNCHQTQKKNKAPMNNIITQRIQDSKKEIIMSLYWKIKLAQK
jgi:hypothetical protein